MPTIKIITDERDGGRIRAVMHYHHYRCEHLRDGQPGDLCLTIFGNRDHRFGSRYASSGIVTCASCTGRVCTELGSAENKRRFYEDYQKKLNPVSRFTIPAMEVFCIPRGQWSLSEENFSGGRVLKGGYEEAQE